MRAKFAPLWTTDAPGRMAFVFGAAPSATAQSLSRASTRHACSSPGIARRSSAVIVFASKTESKSKEKEESSEEHKSKSKEKTKVSERAKEAESSDDNKSEAEAAHMDSTLQVMDTGMPQPLDHTRTAHDPWEAYLEGTECERNADWQTASDWYGKSLLYGFAQVSEIHYRWASSLFRIGDVIKAYTEWTKGMESEANRVGNAFHIANEFEQTYGPQIPSWVGPEASFQRGVCLYCCGEPGSARKAFKVEALTGRGELEEGLWFLASTARYRGKEAAREAEMEEQEMECENELCLLVDLYRAKNDAAEKEKLEEVLKAIEKAQGDLQLELRFYTALYYHAYQQDDEKAKEMLQKVLSMEKYRHEFLWHTAQNGFWVEFSAADAMEASGRSA